MPERSGVRVIHEQNFGHFRQEVVLSHDVIALTFYSCAHIVAW